MRLNQLAIALVVVIAARSAAAQSLAPPPPEFPLPTGGPEPPTKPYRWQIITTDLGAVSLMLAGGALGGGPLLLGVGAYALGPPAIHFAHGRHGRAAASLALRVLLPIAARVALSQTEHCDSSDCEVMSAIVQVFAGMATAAVIDAAVIARPSPVSSAPARVSLGFMPSRQGAALVLAGRF